VTTKKLPAAGCPWTDLDADALQLEHFLSLHVVRLANALQRNAARDYLEPNGLTAPEWRILGFVRRFQPVPFGRITEHTLLDKAQVSRSVKRLQAQGLLDVEADEGHAQRLVLSITPAGKRLHEQVRRAAAKAQVRLLSTLAPSQREALWQALHVLAEEAGGGMPELRTVRPEPFGGAQDRPVEGKRASTGSARPETGSGRKRRA
jgi:DNA-binding MarR family transcriptional regulator